MKKYILLSVIIIAAALISAILKFGFFADNGMPVNQLMAEAYSKKYNIPISSLVMETELSTDSFAKGSVSYTDQLGGGLWFAAKTGNGWELVFDGNGIMPCNIADQYKLPREFLSGCVDTENGTFIQR